MTSERDLRPSRRPRRGLLRMTDSEGRPTQPRHGEERPSGPRLEPRRFPIGLTLAAAVVFAACVALGVWQLQRLAWKQHELARIAALSAAPAQSIGPVLARAARGEDVSFTRVVADCAATPPARQPVKMVADNGQWIARLLGACPVTGSPYDGLAVDRGFLTRTRGSTETPVI